MAWFMRVQEIAVNGVGIGKYRSTATSDEDGGGPFGLCDHQHDTRVEAGQCPDAAQRWESY